MILFDSSFFHKFLSPERLNGEPPTFATDFWSIGIILYFIFYEKYPFAIDIDEAEGEIIEKFVTNGEYDRIPNGDTGYTFEPHLEKKKFKQFYGMSSTLAQEKFQGGMKKYRASEGVVTEVPYTGKIDSVIEDMLGSVRSMMTYIGAKNLKNIPKQCVFYRVNNQRNHIFDTHTIGR